MRQFDLKWLVTVRKIKDVTDRLTEEENARLVVRVAQKIISNPTYQRHRTNVFGGT